MYNNEMLQCVNNILSHDPLDQNIDIRFIMVMESKYIKKNPIKNNSIYFFLTV